MKTHLPHRCFAAFVLGFLTLLLTACGGGGGGGDSTSTTSYSATCADGSIKTSTVSQAAAAALCPTTTYTATCTDGSIKTSTVSQAAAAALCPTTTYTATCADGSIKTSTVSQAAAAALCPTTTYTATCTDGSTKTSTVSQAAADAQCPTIGNLSTTITTPTYSVGSNELSIYNGLNAVRLAGGFGTLVQDTALDMAASNHAQYINTNYYSFSTHDYSSAIYVVDPATGNLTGHVESASKPGFTGILPGDRSKYAAGSSYLVTSEAIAFSSTDGADCLSALLKTVFHRAPLLGKGWGNIGIALVSAGDSPLVRNVCIISPAVKTASKIAPTGWTGVYPGVNQTGVPVAMAGEAPDPAPDIAIKGYPVTFYTNAFISTVNTFTLTAAGASSNVPARILMASSFPGYISPFEAHLLPTQSLAASTTYTATFSALLTDGTTASKTWSFTTQ